LVRRSCRSAHSSTAWFRLKKLRLPLLLVALLGASAGQLTAQTFTNLHSFTAVVATTNSDGANPSCSLFFDGNIRNGSGEIFGADP
jgi:hypothetical protein